MSADTSSLLPQLDELLQRCRLRARVQVVIRGMAAVAICLSGCLWLGCLIDFLFPLPGVIRLLMLVMTTVLATVVAWRGLLRPLMERVSDEELGAAVDLAFPEFQEAVASVMYFRSPAASRAAAGSEVMRRRLLDQVRRDLHHVSASDVIGSRPAAQRSGFALVAGLLIALPLLVWTSGASLLLQRFVLPLSNLGSAANLYFEVPDAERIVALGDAWRIEAIPRWRSGGEGPLPERVVAELHAETSVRDSLPMRYDRELGAYNADLPQVVHAFRYRIAGGGVVTQWFQTQVAERPLIVSTQLQEIPPLWSGRPERLVDGVTGVTDVFEHSQIEIRVQLVKAAETVELRWKDAGSNLQQSAESPRTEPAEISPGGRAATIRFEAIRGGRFELIVRDHLGLTNSAEPERRLNVIRDQPPVLIVTGLPKLSEMRPTDVVPLDCEVTDDTGIAGLELEFQKNDDQLQVRPAPIPATGLREFRHEFRLAFSELGLDTGDRVTIRVRADDRRGVPGPQSVWQGPWTIAISPTAPAPGAAALTQENQQLIDRLRSLERKLHEAAEVTDSVRSASKGLWDDKSRQRVQELSQTARDLGRQLPPLADEVAQHPLMQRQAEETEPLSEALQQSIPQSLDRAAEADQTGADDLLQRAGSQLRSVHDQLHSLIDEIEFLARLEPRLAELNRMSLAAEQLASESDQLERDQQSGEDQRSLQKRRRELERARKQLSRAVDSLLKQEPELLASARRAQREKLDDLAGGSQAMAEQQELLAENLANESLSASRNADRAPQGTAPPANRFPPQPPTGLSPASAVQAFLERVSQMTEANRGLAPSLQADPAASADAADHAERSVDQASRGLQAARSGDFAASANLIQAAAASSQQAAEALTEDADQDRRSQLEAWSDEMSRLAPMMRPLQYDELTRRSVQQNTLNTLTADARELSARLSDVADRMDLPTLGMSQEGQQVSEARQAAGSGADSGAQAAAGLENADLDAAAREAALAADHLQRSASLSQQAATRERDENPLVPSHVGDQITEALLQLDRAGRRSDRQSDPAQQKEKSDHDGEGGDVASAADEPEDNGENGNPAADDAQAIEDQQGRQSAEVGGADEATDEQSEEQEPGDDADAANEDGSPSESQTPPGQDDAGQDDAGQDDAGQDSQSMKSGKAGSRTGRSKSGPSAGRSGASRQLSEAARALARAARASLPGQLIPGQSADADERSTGESQETSETGEQATMTNGARFGRAGRFRARLQDQLDQEMRDTTAEYVDHDYAELIHSYRRQLARTPAVRGGDEPQSGAP